jgi:hypothetical protein
MGYEKTVGKIERWKEKRKKKKREREREREKRTVSDVERLHR